MVTSGAPRCPHCGADQPWGATQCAYCGSRLTAQAPWPPDRLIEGPFPRELRVERHSVVRAKHELYDGDTLLGTFTQSWPAGIKFSSSRGYRYRMRRKRMLRMVLHWTCGPTLVAWVEQSRLWIRRYRLHYGGARYWLLSVSPMSLGFLLNDEGGTTLAMVRPAPLLRAPHLTVCAPLPLELVALFYATALVLWRQAITA